MNADHLEEVMLQQVGPIIACPFPPPSAPLDRLSNLPARFSEWAPVPLQVAVLSEGQVLPLWVRGQALARLKVTACSPHGTVRLTAGCELHVAPKPRLREGGGPAAASSCGGDPAAAAAGQQQASMAWRPVWLRVLPLGPAYLLPIEEAAEPSPPPRPLSGGASTSARPAPSSGSCSWLTTVALVAPNTRLMFPLPSHRPGVATAAIHPAPLEANDSISDRCVGGAPGAAADVVCTGQLLLIQAARGGGRNGGEGGEASSSSPPLVRHAAVRAVVSRCCPAGHVLLAPPLMQVSIRILSPVPKPPQPARAPSPFAAGARTAVHLVACSPQHTLYSSLICPSPGRCYRHWVYCSTPG